MKVEEKSPGTPHSPLPWAPDHVHGDPVSEGGGRPPLTHPRRVHQRRRRRRHRTRAGPECSADPHTCTGPGARPPPVAMGASVRGGGGRGHPRYRRSRLARSAAVDLILLTVLPGWVPRKRLESGPDPELRPPRTLYNDLSRAK